MFTSLTITHKATPCRTRRYQGIRVIQRFWLHDFVFNSYLLSYSLIKTLPLTWWRCKCFHLNILAAQAAKKDHYSSIGLTFKYMCYVYFWRMQLNKRTVHDSWFSFFHGKCLLYSLSRCQIKIWFYRYDE